MDSLRLGVVGVGSVVREIYQYLYFKSDYAPILKVEAAADPNEAGLAWFGETYGIPRERRFRSHAEMLAKVALDAVQVNTPDHLHAGPALDALRAGLDVVVPKPLSASVKDSHAMVQAARKAGRLLGVDFHKREDPRIKEAEARYQSGRYGPLQATVWHMLDVLKVADPNHEPRFFATPSFAEQNTPISFLTVHMCDALLKIVNLRPIEARARGWRQKLPSLRPIALKGYDLCDTELVLENGAAAHILSGWHLPNTAHALTVQSSRIICRDGLIDLGLDTPGYHEIHPDGIFEVNPLFRNFEKDGRVTGYGMSSPGRIYRKILEDRQGRLDAAARAAMMAPNELGFYTTLVLEGAERSLREGRETAPGVVEGKPVRLGDLLKAEIGAEAAAEYGY